MKLNNIVASDTLVITQRTHGKNQGGMAMDFSTKYAPGIAPADGRFLSEYLGSTSTDDDNAFLFGVPEDGWVIQFTHARCINKGNMKRGERMWDTTWHHVHVAVMINPKSWANGVPKGGTWYPLLDFLDQSYKLGWLTPTGKHPIWTSKGTYTDRQLRPIIEVIEYEMVGLPNPIKCVTTNTVPMNLRKEPSTKSESLAKINPGHQFTTQLLSSGEAIENIATWFRLDNGWVNGRFVQQVLESNDPELQKQLDAANKLILEQTTQINALGEQNQVLKADNDILKPTVDALKLVNNTK